MDKEKFLKQEAEDNWNFACKIETIVRDEFQKDKITSEEAMKKIIYELNEL